MYHAVIMAGGSGTRLWPESRRDRPKQFLNFEGDRSMIAATVDRLSGFVPPERVLVVTAERLRGPLVRDLPELEPSNILGEPAPRNTAPCIGWAAVEILRRDPEGIMVVLPADHVIRPEEKFRDTLRFAGELIEEDAERLVTLGVRPTFPSTSYGYIRRDEALGSPVCEKWGSLTTAYSVAGFHEKPNIAKAEEFLARGVFAWNAGIFVWKAKTVLERIRRFEPEIAYCLDAIAADGSPETIAGEFPRMKSISIDYAVMERAGSIVMLEAPFAWDDVGTWCSLDRLYENDKDAAGNIGIGDAEILAVDSRNNTVRNNIVRSVVRSAEQGETIGSKKRLYALLGVEDLIIVETEDATLIARKDREEAVREIIEKLRETGRDDLL